MDYKARFYSPMLGRFISPDTITPGGPQGLNRYSYVANNPINFNDPTGHNEECGLGQLGCKNGVYTAPSDQTGSLDRVIASFGITTSGDFSRKEKWAILRAARLVGDKFTEKRKNGETAADAFIAVYGGLNFKKEEEGSVGICGDPTKPVASGGCTDNAHDIRFWSMSGHADNGIGDINRMMKNVVHELGHAFNNSLSYQDPNDPLKTRKPDNDMSSTFTRAALLLLNQSSSLGQRWEWQQSLDNTGSEIFGDMFIAWTYNAWNADPFYATEVNAAQGWMNGLVP